MKTFIKTMAIAVFIFSFLTTAQAQSTSDKVYWMMTATVSVNDIPKFHEMNSKEIVPLMTKHGYKWVATWQTIVGDIEEIISVAEFKDMAAYHKARNSLMSSSEWKTVSGEFGEVVKSIKSRFLSAAPYSALK